MIQFEEYVSDGWIQFEEYVSFFPFDVGIS